MEIVNDDNRSFVSKILLRLDVLIFSSNLRPLYALFLSCVWRRTVTTIFSIADCEKIVFHLCYSIFFLTFSFPKPKIVLSLFLFFRRFKPHCSY